MVDRPEAPLTVRLFGEDVLRLVIGVPDQCVEHHDSGALGGVPSLHHSGRQCFARDSSTREHETVARRAAGPKGLRLFWSQSKNRRIGYANIEPLGDQLDQGLVEVEVAVRVAAEVRCFRDPVRVVWSRDLPRAASAIANGTVVLTELDLP